MNLKNLKLVSTKNLQRDEIEYILDTAEQMEQFVKNPTKILEDKIICLLFFEPSTRTRFSFQTACHKLGAKLLVQIGMDTSSLKKGESLEDTLKVIEQYADLIVMRHSEAGSAERAANAINIPFINAGDGANEHPTHALLDLFTLRKERGRIDGTKIAFVGDIKNGRPIHSLIHMLTCFKDIELTFISPEALKLPDDLRKELQESKIQFTETDNFEEIKDADLIYMTRIQEERFDNKEEYEKYKGVYILSNDALKKSKENVIIFHPLPRVNEIAKEVDDQPGAAYFRHAKNGVPLRMALLMIGLGKD